MCFNSPCNGRYCVCVFLLYCRLCQRGEGKKRSFRKKII
nr:MAG TPA: hypothetical protein [Caudoviricetes sp.]DAV88702.1 MAG TPA: hypothetical protein [Caudoviricetes sp.]